jgi:protein-disulfide isomerase
MRNILIILGVITVLAVAGVGIYQWQAAPPKAPAPTASTESAASAEEIARAKAISADDFTIGKADAPVTVIEYASLTCPHCANFHVNVLPRLKTEYIDTGKVRMAFRDFPLDQAALAAAMVARCAGRERHYGITSLFFARQQQWAGANESIGAMARLTGLAGMSADDVQACLKKEDVEKAVLDQRLLSEKVFAINATPSFIINGTLHSGGMTFEEFKAVIDPLLTKASGTK